MTEAARVVAVLGYSNGRAGGLHPICAARLRRAVEVATEVDVVVLSGWARGRSELSEAELMRGTWPEGSGRVVCDPLARTTAENAVQVAAIASELAVGEVVLVTSDWHAPRARLLFRAALRGSGSRVEVVPVSSGRPWRCVLGEVWRWPLVPVQLALARRSV